MGVRWIGGRAAFGGPPVWTMVLVLGHFATSEARSAVRAVPGSYPSIQSAIMASSNGDEVIVAPGVYPETIRFMGKSITVRSSGGATMTIIDATGLNNSAVRFIDFETRSAMLIGFTITGGTGEPINAMEASGGGILIRNSSPTILNCIVRQNFARGLQCQVGGGGGAFCAQGAPLFVNCIFDRNSADEGGCGGAINNVNAQTVVVNCTFHKNTAWRFGGMIGGAVAVNSIFSENFGWPYDEGAQLYLTSTVKSCLIEDLKSLAGNGNFDADPGFVDAAAGDLRLSADSPAIDAGDNGLYMEHVGSLGLVRDMDGAPRFAAGRVGDGGNVPAAAGSPLSGSNIDLGPYEIDAYLGDLDGDGDVDLSDASLMFLLFTGP